MGLNIREYFEKYTPFFEGMGGLNIFGSHYKSYWMKNNLTPQEQDALAIRGDWEKVGDDLEKAINNFKKEEK